MGDRDWMHEPEKPSLSSSIEKRLAGSGVGNDATFKRILLGVVAIGVLAVAAIIGLR